MKIKTTLTTISITAAMLLSPMSAFAQTQSPIQLPTASAVKSSVQTARLTAIQTRCDTAITTRITALNEVASKVTSLVKLTSTQKAQYTSQITTNVNGLTTLKAKCDADTDLTTLKADYQSVFTQYRVYAEFLPQIHLLIASDTMGVTAQKLSDLVIKLQTRIQSAGNPAKLVTVLSDMQAKVTDANTQYTTVESTVGPLTPQSYDSNPIGTKTILTTARTTIKTGALDLKTAIADAKQIVLGLKTMHPTGTVTSSPSATVTP